jgi:hypothetical protein
LTRQVINSEEERNAKADILELINFERFCRDNLQWIQSMTGHADIDMTQHYLHVQKEVKEVAADKLNCLFTKTSLELNSSTIPVRSRHQG